MTNALAAIVTTSCAVLASAAGIVWYLRTHKSKASCWYSKLPVYKLKNSTGIEVDISPVGATILRLRVPDKKGKKADVVLAYQKVSSYVTAEPITYFGAIVGRVANRIAEGKFSIAGEEYKLLANNGPNALHGGVLGLHKRKWDVSQYTTNTHQVVELQYTSPHGEEGYPGNLHISVAYKLAKDKNELTCSIAATTDELTPVSIAQHSYFNLGGHASGTILDHRVQIYGDHYTPVNDVAIPTGDIVPVQGTPFDFTQPHTVGERIDQVPGGYDHNFVLFNMGPQARFITKKGIATDRPKLAATVVDPKSGRALDVLTTAPGLQFYSGNFLGSSGDGKGGVQYPKYGGLCLETQGFPNAVNEARFPDVLLQPEDTYRHEILYKFYNA